MKKVFRGANVIDVSNGIEGAKDILVDGERIESVDAPGSFDSVAGAEFIELGGKLLVPGMIDIHVHLREPGFEWKETILTGTRSAVAGGFTDVCCMPNTNPAIDNAQVVEFILEQADKAGLARVHPVGAVSVGREGKAMAPMGELREAGCVAFSDDGSPVWDAGLMRKALEYSLMFDTVITVHEEEHSLCKGFVMNESALSLKLGLAGMPDAAENVMIARDIELARLTGGRVHFQHVSSARGVQLIRRAKEDGIPVTAEAMPHNFTLTEEVVADYNTLAKVAMPIRSEADRKAILAGLADGTLDCIATDHAPHEADSKNVEFDRASFGLIGLQSALPLTLAQVRAGAFSMKRAIEMLTSAPARCMNLTPNSFSKGAEANITVIDPELKLIHSKQLIQSKSKNTPFLGWEMQGNAVQTYIKGKRVFDISEILPKE